MLLSLSPCQNGDKQQAHLRVEAGLWKQHQAAVPVSVHKSQTLVDGMGCPFFLGLSNDYFLHCNLKKSIMNNYFVFICRKSLFELRALFCISKQKHRQAFPVANPLRCSPSCAPHISFWKSTRFFFFKCDFLSSLIKLAAFVSKYLLILFIAFQMRLEKNDHIFFFFTYLFFIYLAKKMQSTSLQACNSRMEDRILCD